MAEPASVRFRIHGSGVVQGVGFRPFVSRLARRHALTGFICNRADGVLLEVQGRDEVVQQFMAELVAEQPPAASIAELRKSPIAPVEGEEGFAILLSQPDFPSAGTEYGAPSERQATLPLIPPDRALCSSCREELADPANRRYRHPFVSCTDCGPRFTVVQQLPYDRSGTTMAPLPLCPECRQEYGNPHDRRFHAETIACHHCGPQLRLLDAAGTVIAGDPVKETIRLLQQGKVIGIKSTGGFHLAVDARNDRALSELRHRKARPAKPFAVMMRDAEVVAQYCIAGAEELQVLHSAMAPIVLLEKKCKDGAGGFPDSMAERARSEPAALSGAIAPSVGRLGVMLPATPLQLLLFGGLLDVLVMTSANRHGDPVMTDNDEAISELGSLFDALLLHDLPIAQRCDDSVGIVHDGVFRLLRRSRGAVPAPLSLSASGPVVLAVGGELKNTLTLLSGSSAIMSQHIGDLQSLGSYRHFQQGVAWLMRQHRAQPELLVHDLHPGYLSTRWAREQQVPLFGVQHHHAHMVSCMAEHRHEGPAIGLILDGTGYGTDGTVWGGEVLIGDAAGVERFASLEPMPLPGGEQAIKEPWRAATGYLYRSFDGAVPATALPPWPDRVQAGAVMELLQQGIALVDTTSCGRLFDVVAALCGMAMRVSYEAEGAIMLMEQGRKEVAAAPLSIEIAYHKKRRILRVSPIVRDVVTLLAAGTGVAEVSARLHRTLAEAFSDLVRQASLSSGIRTVVLSGGVFQNEFLFATMVSALRHRGLRVLTHAAVPTNDGGLSLGQAVIGRAYLQL